MPKPTNYLSVPIVVAIGCTLVNNAVFGPATLFAYFGYTLLACCIATIAGIGYYQQKQPTAIAHPQPLVLLGLLAVYYVFNGIVNNPAGSMNLRQYYMVANALLLGGYYMGAATGAIRFATICWGITLLAGAEGVVCLLQQNGTINSKDALFAVTGTCVNPNVTAMFLAMALPAMLYAWHNSKKLGRIAISMALAATAIGLVLLKCRTALIGSAVVLTLFCNHRYQLVQQLRQQKRWLVVVLTVCLVGIVTVALSFLYHSKQASSDGRAFIWKISLRAIAQKPWLGSGYGQFEHDYNLAQAAYFNQGLGTQQEINNAAYVRMSYNEFLENTVEGGILGLLLFVALLLVLWMQPNRSITAQMGIACFATMGIFNFTVQALPVMAVLLVYLIPDTHAEPQKTRNSPFVIPNWLPALPTIGAACLLLQLLGIAKAYHQCTTLQDSTEELGKTEILRQLAALQPQLSQSVFYWRSYGKLLYQSNNYPAALAKFKQAALFSSDPDLYLSIGTCYAKMAQYSNAAQAYTLARYTEPHRFAPQMALLKLHYIAKDTAAALAQARAIVAMQPKIPSDKVTHYKQEAQKVLQILKKETGNRKKELGDSIKKPNPAPKARGF